ncbi:hypothetical protein ACJW31_04G048100 [Castanea mollissima]
MQNVSWWRYSPRHYQVVSTSLVLIVSILSKTSDNYFLLTCLFCFTDCLSVERSGLTLVTLLQCCYIINLTYLTKPLQKLWHHFSPDKSQFPDQNAGGVQGRQIGENVSRKDKINFLVNTVSITI